MLARRFENAETLSGHTSSITTLRFSPEGEYLASGCEGGVVLVTSTESWQIVQKAVNISPVTALRWDCTFPMTLVCGFASGAVLTVHIGDTDNDLVSQTLFHKTRAKTTNSAGRLRPYSLGGRVPRPHPLYRYRRSRQEVSDWPWL